MSSNATRNTLNTLFYYRDVYVTPENPNHHPILLLRTVNGEKRMDLLEDRSQLPFYQKVQAYLGFGEASLYLVADFLRSKKLEIIDQAQETLEIIDSKIARTNASSWVQQINSLK